MVKRFKDFLNENSLHVFDIDDTLFHTGAKVRVMKGANTVGTLSSSEYNSHKLPAGHHYDYSEFRDSHKFDTESKPIHNVMNKMKSIHSTLKAKGKGRVIMNTARQDFDDKDKFLGTFRKHGVDIDNIHVHRAGNLAHDKGMSIGHAKNEIIRQHLNTGKYTHVSLYDDSKENLNHFKELSKEHPNVRFKAYHVQPDGNIKHYKWDYTMAIYTFKNKRSGKTKEYELKMSEYDQFKEDHPELERIIDMTVFNMKTSHGSVSVTEKAAKKNAGWAEVLSKIGEQNPHSPLAQDHHRNKSIKRIRTEQIVEKHSKIQADAQKAREKRR